MHPIKLKELPAVISRSLLARTNLWVWGEPGLGKTDTLNESARQLRSRIEAMYHGSFYVPTMSPTDIQCAMPNVDTKMMDIYSNAALPNAYTHPDLIGFVHFGEAGNADSATGKLLQKYVNGEDMNGCLRKPDGVIVVCDGNRLQDKSGVIQQGRALLNRFEHIDVYTDVMDNREYADHAGFHPTVQSFFKDNPDHINNYSLVFEGDSPKRKDKKAEEIAVYTEEGKRGIWASMRGWKRVSDKEYAAHQLHSTLSVNEIAGSVGTSVAMLYEAQRNAINLLARIEDIRADPKKAKLPTKASEVFAQACVVALMCEEKDLPVVKTYCSRMAYDFQSVVLRKLTQRKNFNLIENGTYTQWIDDPQLKALMMPNVKK